MLPYMKPNIAYGVGERSGLNFILVMFEDKTNYNMDCGVNFYSLRIIKHDIN